MHQNVKSALGSNAVGMTESFFQKQLGEVMNVAQRVNAAADRVSALADRLVGPRPTPPLAHDERVDAPCEGALGELTSLLNRAHREVDFLNQELARLDGLA